MFHLASLQNHSCDCSNTPMFCLTLKKTYWKLWRFFSKFHICLEDFVFFILHLCFFCFLVIAFLPACNYSKSQALKIVLMVAFNRPAKRPFLKSTNLQFINLAVFCSMKEVFFFFLEWMSVLWKIRLHFNYVQDVYSELNCLLIFLMDTFWGR